MQTIKTVPLSKFAKFSNIRLGAYYELPTLVFEYEPFMGFIELLEAGSRPSGGINVTKVKLSVWAANRSGLTDH